MGDKTNPIRLLVRVRPEGRSLVISIPAATCEALGLKGGDILAVRAVSGELVARRIDLTRAVAAYGTDRTREGE
jgi:antitoxin component of MazEF toxin-antitoxin module